jgi:hypothetical protein
MGCSIIWFLLVLPAFWVGITRRDLIMDSKIVEPADLDVFHPSQKDEYFLFRHMFGVKSPMS